MKKHHIDSLIAYATRQWLTGKISDYTYDGILEDIKREIAWEAARMEYAPSFEELMREDHAEAEIDAFEEERAFSDVKTHKTYDGSRPYRDSLLELMAELNSESSVRPRPANDDC